MAKVEVVITANFENNLESIRCYFHQLDGMGSNKFEKLLNTLFDTIIPNLQAYPEIGADFLVQKVSSLEELRMIEMITHKLPSDSSIRAYNDRDYKLLYLLKNSKITLLAIKQHKQLYFDLREIL